MFGTVKKIVASDGYGFVKPDDGVDDLFFHCRQLRPPLVFDEQLYQRRVEFDVEDNPATGRQRAVNVRAVAGPVETTH